MFLCVSNYISQTIYRSKSDLNASVRKLGLLMAVTLEVLLQAQQVMPAVTSNFILRTLSILILNFPFI